MKIHDISMTISKTMPVYHNDDQKRPKITHEEKEIYESTITMGMHTGTHVDAPLHMIQNSETMEIYPIDDFITSCKVFDLTKLNISITKNDLIEKDIKEGDFILFKTKNSFSEQFVEDFIYLSQDGALYLKDKNIKGVGIDNLGIERNHPDHETHKILLSNRIMIVEGLQLQAINEGEYTLCVLPLKIAGVEASPARAVLIEKD